MPFIVTNGGTDFGSGRQGEESEIGESRPGFAAFRRTAKIVAACTGLAGLTVCALAWKASSRHPSFRSGGTRAAVSLAEDTLFDCYAEAQNWRNAWSEHQKEYCCLHTHVGCSTVKETRSTVVGEVQQLDEVQSFPVDVQSTSFNCAEGFSNWRSGWSTQKKEWCCKSYELGCVESANYTGWLLFVVGMLVIAGTASVLICLAVRKRSKEDELRSRWSSYQSPNDKTQRRCCAGMFKGEEEKSWFGF